MKQAWYTVMFQIYYFMEIWGTDPTKPPENKVFFLSRYIRATTNVSFMQRFGEITIELTHIYLFKTYLFNLLVLGVQLVQS